MKIGPFLKDELKSESLTRNSKIWYYGLSEWTDISEIEELKELLSLTPPDFKSKSKKTQIDIPVSQKDTALHDIGIKNKINKKGLKKIGLTVIILFSLLLGYILIQNQKEAAFYESIALSAYDADTDFQFYIDKFYRDIEIYGLIPKKPKTQIIKFAKLDQIDDATHIHALSFGYMDDDRIEIYINPSTWEKFNKPLRYYLIYHELSHDVLNLDDLEESSINKDHLMYPNIASFEYLNMDEFIERSHSLFEEVSENEQY